MYLMPGSNKLGPGGGGSNWGESLVAMDFGRQWNSAISSYLNIYGPIKGVSMRAAPTAHPVGLYKSITTGGGLLYSVETV